MNISGNTVLITGGSSGIGFELARRLLELGNTVIITGRSDEKLRHAEKSLPGLHTVKSDVSDVDEIKALFETVTRKFPELNFLINNAGILRSINLNSANELSELTREIETNLNGPIRMVQQFLPHLKSKSSSAIVNVTSGLAYVPLPVSPVYCATKAGLHSYTRSLRAQLKNSTVKVFELAPPATRTEILDAYHVDDMKGVAIMPLEKMVSIALKGIQSDRWEIRPGQANQLKFLNRIAPEFIFGQLSKTVDRMINAPAR